VQEREDGKKTEAASRVRVAKRKRTGEGRRSGAHGNRVAAVEARGGAPAVAAGWAAGHPVPSHAAAMPVG
jgi:hypothetical protein